MKHSSNVFTVLLLAAFLALVGVTVVVGSKLSGDYKLSPQQMLGLEPAPNANEKSQPPAKPGAAGTLPAELKELSPRMAVAGEALAPASSAAV